MKSTRLLAAMLIGMAASMSVGATSVLRSGLGASSLKPPKTALPSRTVGSSRNGGHRSGNRAHQRLALKKRNQARHRAACRG